VNAKEWKCINLYSDMHELFFMEYPCMLHEWLKRKATINSVALPLEPMVWDQAMLDSLKVLDNKWTRAIDFWFARVKESYIIEFIVEYSDYFIEDKRKLEEGPRKWMLQEFPL
jgi:hypothetical protein